MADNKPTATVKPLEEVVPITKPSAFDLNKFKSKRPATLAGVGTLLNSLPHHPISQAKDFVRLHGNDDYWSPELCFVQVPVKGATKETLHLIDEDLAMQYLSSGNIQRFRLVLAAKPYDRFFLCHVPTRNTDNKWNEDNVKACEQAKNMWVRATSRREEGIDGYKIDFAHSQDAFDGPKWPEQSLGELIGVTFANRQIDTADHPSLLRLIGAKQNLS